MFKPILKSVNFSNRFQNLFQNWSNFKIAFKIDFKNKMFEKRFQNKFFCFKNWKNKPVPESNFWFFLTEQFAPFGSELRLGHQNSVHQSVVRCG